MKLNKIFNITAGVAMLIGATGCSSDYLDLEPEGYQEYEEVLPTEQGARLAVMGMCNAMYKQYSGISDGSLGFNGEPELLQYYAEVPGQDLVSIFWMYYGGSSLINWGNNGTSNMNNPNGSSVAWGYCYSLISQANNLISYTPKVTDEEGNVVEDPDYNFNPVPDVEGEHAFRYAQALTFRAHAYIRLMQIYCARYEDRFTSTGDWSLTVPLRLEFVEPEGDLNMGLATWEELINQIYGDLQQAIDLYAASGRNREYMFEPDAAVAKGLLARAAMINHDWATARQMAKEARQGFPLMTSEEYAQGFANPNSEWMWCNSGESQGLYYYSFGATYACNGAYPCRWTTIGAGGISQDLMSQVSLNDDRALLYFSPMWYGGDDKPLFWSDDQVESQTMNINGQTYKLHELFVKFCDTKYSNVAENGWDAPYTLYGYPVASMTTVCAAVFGAQFKFWGTDNYSASHYPFMRASEMLLTEAEAAYMDGDQKAADDLLYEMNKARYVRYTASYSGAELLQQIKISRRMELWGEGFNWFDFKRWNEPIVRTAWQSKDVNSGNWPELYAGTINTDVANGWRWRIPLVELNYNEALNDLKTTLQYGYDW